MAMKVVSVVGARPQFVKAAVMSRQFAAGKAVEEILLHTGQHYDANMSEIFFEEMCIPTPKYNLNIHGMGHGAMTGQMLEKIEEVLKVENPEWVLVYGDTNSTLAAALAARKMHIKVAHVEAGLRSFNMQMPEEINRILTDRISDILFCPTQTAIDNLDREGVRHWNAQVELVGDVMQDAAFFYKDKAKKPDFDLPEKFVLCTVHREENTDNPSVLSSIFTALEQISRTLPVLIPLHPRTRSRLEQLNYDFAHTSIRFVEPVGYLQMVYLLQRAEFVMSDSGGLQKEAYFFNKYCVTLRPETEWVELVENGFNFVAGSVAEEILRCADRCRRLPVMDSSLRLYGNGDAALKIEQSLMKVKTKCI